MRTAAMTLALSLSLFLSCIFFPSFLTWLSSLSLSFYFSLSLSYVLHSLLSASSYSIFSFFLFIIPFYNSLNLSVSHSDSLSLSPLSLPSSLSLALILCLIAARLLLKLKHYWPLDSFGVTRLLPAWEFVSATFCRFFWWNLKFHCN